MEGSSVRVSKEWTGEVRKRVHNERVTPKRTGEISINVIGKETK